MFFHKNIPILLILDFKIIVYKMIIEFILTQAIRL